MVTDFMMDLVKKFIENAKTLAGNECWNCSLTIGSTLMLDFGRKLTYDPPMVNPNSGNIVEIGEFNFLIFSSWKIENDNEIIASWRDKFWNIKKLDETIGMLLGNKVKYIDLAAPAFDLEIVFENHLRLKVFCDSFTSGEQDKSNYYFSTLHELFAVKSQGMLVVKNQDMKRVFV